MKQSKEALNEGLISYAHDLYLAFRIIKILYQDFNKTQAFKLGIIDENGTKIKSPENMEEKSAYSPFNRLIFKIKKLLALVPGGKTKFGSLIAAYALLKENEEFDISSLTKEHINTLFEDEEIVIEDAPVNVSAGVAKVDKPVGPIVKRKEVKTFKVSEKTIKECSIAKTRMESWIKYISEVEVLDFISANPGVGFVLVEEQSGDQLFLKSPKAK